MERRAYPVSPCGVGFGVARAPPSDNRPLIRERGVAWLRSILLPEKPTRRRRLTHHAARRAWVGAAIQNGCR